MRLTMEQAQQIDKQRADGRTAIYKDIERILTERKTPFSVKDGRWFVIHGVDVPLHIENWA